MKDFTQKLLSLLHTCADDQEESGRLMQLAKIIRSEDYQELENHHAFRTEYQAEWTVAQLESLSSEELQKKALELHNLAEMLRRLQKAILWGNGPDLTQYDFYSFKNHQLISKLVDKLSLSKTQKNYSNIDDRCLMKIFEPATVKSAKDCFAMLPLFVTKKSQITEEDLRAAMSSRLYCVNIEEFHRVHREFLEFSSQAEETIKNEKQRRRKHGLFKAAVVMTLFLAIFACDQFGLFSQTYTAAFSVMMFFNILLYLIWG